jgi:aspartate/methionine/tyrosine aminotransferase
MRFKPFKLERYFAKYEFKAPYIMCSSDCESLTIKDLLDLETGAEEAFMKVWLGYTQTEGDPLLRDQIATLYSEIDPDEILVHAGAEEAIFNTMNVVLDPGDHVIVHYPCYQSLAEIAQSIGCHVTLWEASENKNWALDLDFFKKNIRPNTKLVVINCPHNPTGYLMPPDEFDELVNLSRKHGFMIFSDEVYRLLEYEHEDRLPAICEIDDRGASLGVMSKTFGLAGLRIGWIATRNKKLLKNLAARKDYTTICNSAPSEFLATLALKHKDALIRRNLNIIKKNLMILDDFFKRYSQRFSWQSPKAGPISFPGLTQGNVENFCNDLLNRAGVLLLPGTLYDSSYSNFRVGFGRANLGQCIQKFEEYLLTAIDAGSPNKGI